MSAKRMYLVLLAAAVVAGCALRILQAGAAGFGSASGLGETIGRVGALFLAASLASTVWVLLFRKRTASAASATAVGIGVVVAFSYSSYRVIEFEQSQTASTPPVVARQTFSPKGCDFAVAFPSKPKTTSVIVPEFGEILEAEISDPRGLMRANCINASDVPGGRIAYYGDRELLLQTVQAHAEQNGLMNVSYTYENSDLGTRASARGTKQLEGMWVTYETIWLVSLRSAMSLMTGYFSDSYPTREISEFLDSVTRTDRSSTSTSSESLLKLTVIDGDYYDVERELNNKQWSADDLGMALLAAAGKNKSRVAALLITSGANPNYSVLGRTGVVISASENNPEILEVLLERGADPHWKSTFDWRPLHFAINKDESFDNVILLLLEHGATVDVTTNLLITPLHRAAGFCRDSAVQILLQHGASKKLLDKYGQTAAQRAAISGCNEIASLLKPS